MEISLFVLKSKNNQGKMERLWLSAHLHMIIIAGGIYGDMERQNLIRIQERL